MSALSVSPSFLPSLPHYLPLSVFLSPVLLSLAQAGQVVSPVAPPMQPESAMASRPGPGVSGGLASECDDGEATSTISTRSIQVTLKIPEPALQVHASTSQSSNRDVEVGVAVAPCPDSRAEPEREIGRPVLQACASVSNLYLSSLAVPVAVSLPVRV